MTAWEAREIWPIAPIGYVSLLEAADRVGRTMYGDGWRTPPETQQRQMEADVEFELVITKVATACEVGEINSACRHANGVGQKAAYGLAARFALTMQVEVCIPDLKGSDWNDVLLAGA
jgi:hypothetical protein